MSKFIVSDHVGRITLPVQSLGEYIKSQIVQFDAEGAFVQGDGVPVVFFDQDLIEPMSEFDRSLSFLRGQAIRIHNLQVTQRAVVQVCKTLLGGHGSSRGGDEPHRQRLPTIEGHVCVCNTFLSQMPGSWTNRLRRSLSNSSLPMFYHGTSPFQIGNHNTDLVYMYERIPLESPALGLPESQPPYEDPLLDDWHSMCNGFQEDEPEAFEGQSEFGVSSDVVGPGAEAIERAEALIGAQRASYMQFVRGDGVAARSSWNHAFSHVGISTESSEWLWSLAQTCSASSQDAHGLQPASSDAVGAALQQSEATNVQIDVPQTPDPWASHSDSALSQGSHSWQSAGESCAAPGMHAAETALPWLAIERGDAEVGCMADAATHGAASSSWQTFEELSNIAQLSEASSAEVGMGHQNLMPAAADNAADMIHDEEPVCDPAGTDQPLCEGRCLPCFFYHSGTCTYGDTCRFDHCDSCRPPKRSNRVGKGCNRRFNAKKRQRYCAKKRNEGDDHASL